MKDERYEDVLSLAVGVETVVVARDRERGSFVLGRRPWAGGTGLDGYVPASTRAAGQTVVGGMLPDGAAGAVIIDDAGEEHRATAGAGAYLAAIGPVGFGDDDLVRFVDADGALVPRPLESTGERIPVEDAPEPCPICATAAWERSEEDEGERVIVCARCGYAIRGLLHIFALRGVGAVEEDVDEEDRDEDDVAPPDEAPDTAWKHERDAWLAGVRMPVYAVAGRPGEISGWGGSTDKVDVDHGNEDEGWVNVATDAGEQYDGIETSMRERLEHLVGSETWPGERSEAATQVWHAHHDRQARRIAAGVQPRDVSFAIDGAPEPFRIVAAGDAWVAARDHYGVRIQLAAKGVAPDGIELTPLAEVTKPEHGTTGTPAPRVVAARRARAGELLSRAEVAALIAEYGLEAHTDAIVAAVRPGYRLTTEGADSNGVTRIGGTPDLLADETWPMAALAMPYTHLAQIDCSALPPLPAEWAGPAWEHGGRLVRIFADLVGRVPDPGDATALACDPRAELARRDAPPLPDPWPAEAFDVEPDTTLHVLPEVAARAAPFLTVLNGWSVLGEAASFGSPLEEAFRDFAARLRAGGGDPGHTPWIVQQLLGYADDVQGEDVRSAGPLEHERDPVLAERDAWAVLLSLDEDHRMAFWDAGAVAVVAPVADLATGRYDRLVSVPSMG